MKFISVKTPLKYVKLIKVIVQEGNTRYIVLFYSSL